VPSPPHLTPPLIPQPPAGGSLSTETGGRFGPKSAIGVDEIFWRKHHHYLTLVTDHRRRKVVWGASGREATTLDGFFEELGPGRAAQITAVSMDMEPAFGKSVRGHAPQASICIDPFNVVALGTQALDEVRRPLWQELRSLPDPAIAKKFKGARWALLKKPEDLTTRQAQTLTAIRRGGGRLWRAYQLKEALRAVFAGDLDVVDAEELLGRWCSRAQRSRLEPFVKLAATVRGHRDGILAALRLGINNGLVEGLNNRVRLIVRRAFGFHSPEAALALVMLSCGPHHPASAARASRRLTPSSRRALTSQPGLSAEATGSRTAPDGIPQEAPSLHTGRGH
jgi:transposase